VSAVTEKLREKFEDSVIGGGVAGLEIIIHRLLKENVAPYYKFASKLEKMDDGLIPLLYGLVGGLAEDRFELPNWDFAVSVGVAEMLKGFYARYVQKEPYIVVPDPSHVNAYNLDPNAPVTLIIDGTAQNITATTDANGSVSITLATPLASGKHQIIVTAGKKSAYAVVVV
jgi:hypothetical protein